MSWPLNAIGTPTALCAEIDRVSGTLTGLSKTEFDEAAPAMKSLVSQNVGQGGTMFQLDASGHANFRHEADAPPVKIYGSVSFSLKSIPGRLVTEPAPAA